MIPDRVCVVGSFMMDLTVRASRRPQAGETVVGNGFEMFLGGKGFNQAIAAARSGADTTMIGRVGDDDFGRQFLAHLGVEGIDAVHVGVDARDGTGIGAPLVEDSGENSIVIVPRANGRVTPAHMRAAADSIAASSVLLLQLELPMDVVVEAARIAKSAGVMVILNPAPAPADGRIEALHGLIDVLVPNETEAHILSGRAEPISNLEAVRSLASRLGAAVVMTVGGAGCLVCDRGGLFTVAAHPVEVVDTVGAGDAFCGALGAWIAAGSSLRDAVVHANAAGALAVTRSGAEPSMPRREAILRLVGSQPDHRPRSFRESG